MLPITPILKTHGFMRLCTSDKLHNLRPILTESDKNVSAYILKDYSQFLLIFPYENQAVCLYSVWVWPLLRSTGEGFQGRESVFMNSTRNSGLSTFCLHRTAPVCYQEHKTGICIPLVSFLFFKALSASSRVKI